MGPWKAYWATGPGLGGCDWPTCKKMTYPDESPLLFNVRIDPSEGIPLNPWQGPSPSGNNTGPTDGPPVPLEEIQAVLAKLVAVRTSMLSSTLI